MTVAIAGAAESDLGVTGKVDRAVLDPLRGRLAHVMKERRQPQDGIGLRAGDDPTRVAIDILVPATGRGHRPQRVDLG